MLSHDNSLDSGVDRIPDNVIEKDVLLYERFECKPFSHMYALLKINVIFYLFYMYTQT